MPLKTTEDYPDMPDDMESLPRISLIIPFEPKREPLIFDEGKHLLATIIYIRKMKEKFLIHIAQFLTAKVNTISFAGRMKFRVIVILFWNDSFLFF